MGNVWVNSSKQQKQKKKTVLFCTRRRRRKKCEGDVRMGHDKVESVKEKREKKRTQKLDIVCCLALELSHS